MLKLEPSPLRLPMQQSGSSPGLCTKTFDFQEIFKRAFKIYGIWPQARSVVKNIHTHTSAQCSPASVGLAQARPNYAGPLSCILGCNEQSNRTPRCS